MKEKWFLLPGLLFGAVVAWALAFLFLPVFVRNASFLSGFIACAAFALFVLFSVILWKRKISIQLGSAQGTNTNSTLKATHRSVSRTYGVLFFLLTGLSIAFLLFRQNERIIQQTRMQRVQLAQQAELIETTRNSGLVKWMSAVLQQAEEEMKRDPNRALQDETIATIAALSYSFKPYHRFEADSVLMKELSPERGILLLALCNMNMDTNSAKKIMMQAHFSNADLKDADLRSAYLGGADLQKANLHGANLENANLNGADLQAAALWGANLRNVKMNGVTMKLAELSWSDLSGAEVQNADLEGVNLISAQLRNTDLRGTILKWADCSGAFLNVANLSDTDLYGTVFKRASLEKSDLSNAKMTMVNLTETNLDSAIFTGVELSRAVVTEPDWMTLLPDRLAAGATEIQSTYSLVMGGTAAQLEYVLEKKNK